MDQGLAILTKTPFLKKNVMSSLQSILFLIISFFFQGTNIMVEMERSVTRFVWDVDLEETKIIYQDIGVKELETLVEEKLATERRQGQKVCNGNV